jgi:hypothetical protein
MLIAPLAVLGVDLIVIAVERRAGRGETDDRRPMSRVRASA